MTLTGAKTLLKGKLRCGDQSQIEARRLIDSLARFDDADLCGECDGSGEHECDCGDEHECHYCSGAGISLDECDDETQSDYDRMSFGDKQTVRDYVRERKAGEKAA